ncbi:MAG TPA: hypothetical protein GXZ58_10490 [Bacilli bacterium]|nr:hypothetical protein [Bacilli bacterium]
MIHSDKYVAIIGDILESKQLKKRKEVQQKLKEKLRSVNEKYADDIAAKFMITLGDEFQGLLYNPAHIFTIINEIEMALSPIELRFGIGIGDITTEINYHQSSEVDGPAYHRARQMITEIEKIKSQYTEREANMMICSGTKNGQTDQLLNSILSVCTVLKSKWTDRQQEIIHTYLSHNENQYEAASILKINQSSVSKALKKADFYSYQAAMDTVNSFLNKERSALND